MNNKGSNQSLVKVTNQRLILQEIQNGQQLSRSELAKRLQLSNPSVSKHVDDLLSKGLLVESGALVTDVGRRPIMLQFNGSHGCVAVIDMSSTDTRMCVADLQGNKLEYTRVDGDGFISCEGLNRIISTLRDMLGHVGDRCGSLVGICIGVPGLVDPVSGTVLRSSRFSSDEEITDPSQMLESAFGVPVFVRNDINLAAAGEHKFGAGQEHSSLLLFCINSSSVGLGAVINDQSYEGFHGHACDADSILLPSFDQPDTLCSLSDMLGLDILVKEAGSIITDGRESLLREWVSDPADLLFDDISRAWGMSDVAVGAIVRRYARRVALTFRNLAALYDPELILLGGQAARLGVSFVNEVHRLFEAISPCSTELKLAKLPDTAVIFGGIELATRQAVERIVLQ